MNGENNMDTGASNGGSAGPVIGTIVILLVIVLGAFYFWGGRGEEMLPEMPAEEVEMTSEETVEAGTPVEESAEEMNAS